MGGTCHGLWLGGDGVGVGGWAGFGREERVKRRGDGKSKKGERRKEGGKEEAGEEKG